MGTRTLVLGLILVLAPGAAPGARAEGRRYRVTLPGLPPMYVDDAARQAARFAGPPGLVPPEPSPGPPPAPAPAPPPAPPFEPSAALPATRTTPPAPGPGQVLPEDLAPPDRPPDAEFRTRLADIYGVRDEGEVGAIWTWYVAEPEALTSAERTGNAVVRHALATGRVAPPGALAALEPGARSAVVGGQHGVMVRTEPWGSSIASIPSGTPVELDPPADGVWYRVRTPQAGWVAGLWLGFR